ncbi:MAG: class I SAM-dependent methyltransferase [Actinobacteria bacterium]|nr:class I SAM-dependent methyltransferase [Actinomycetota bacterium]
MSRSHHDTVRERFERDAQSFDAIYRLERSPFWRWVNTTLRKAVFERYTITFEQAGDVTGKKILDVGCGSGVYSIDFARRGAGRVVGVDFSGNMLKLARQEAEQHRVADRCEFIQADFLELDLEDKFDISIAMGVFDYVPDQMTFLRKMVVLTTGKVIVAFPGHSLLREPARRLRYKLSGKGDIYLYSQEDVERIAAEAGLRDKEIIHIPSSGGVYVLVGRCSTGA